MTMHIPATLALGGIHPVPAEPMMMSDVSRRQPT